MADDPAWFDRKAYMKEYNKTPEARAKRKAYMKEYNQRPEVAEKRREYQRQYKLRKKGQTNAST